MKRDESGSELSGLRRGDEAAAQEIWERYYSRLVNLARRNLRGGRRESDEEDVVQSALNSFFQAAAGGRFPRLDDHDGLWKLLVTFTLRKVSKRHRRQSADKRGGGKTRGESVFRNESPGASQPRGLDHFALSEEPTPEIAIEMTEVLDEMLAELPGDDLREIAIMKLEGFQNKEIARRLDVVEMTVSRKLKRIRTRWANRVSERSPE